MKNPETTPPEEIPEINLALYTEGGDAVYSEGYLAEMEIGLAGRAAELVMVANDSHITDPETLANAIDVTSQIKAAYDQIEKERDKYTRPMLLLKRMADGKFKAVTDPLQEAEKRLKGMILTFQRAEQKKIDDAAAAQAKADREAQAKFEAKRAKAEAENAPAPEPPPPPPPPPPSVAPAYGNYGAKATRKQKWAYELKDLTDVPLRFLMVDDKEVKMAIKEGVRDVPGIRIFDEGTVAFT